MRRKIPHRRQQIFPPIHQQRFSSQHQEAAMRHIHSINETQKDRQYQAPWKTRICNLGKWRVHFRAPKLRSPSSRSSENQDRYRFQISVGPLETAGQSLEIPPIKLDCWHEQECMKFPESKHEIKQQTSLFEKGSCRITHNYKHRKITRRSSAVTPLISV